MGPDLGSKAPETSKSKPENEWRKKPEASPNFLALGVEVGIDSQTFVERFVPRIGYYDHGRAMLNPVFTNASDDLYHRMSHRTAESFHFGVDEGLHQAHMAITAELGADSIAAQALVNLIEQRAQQA